MSRRGGQSLSQALDREIYQFVRRAVEGNPADTITSTAIYNDISRSNSSLSRRPKKLLEDSIQRVLDSIQPDTSTDTESTMKYPGPIVQQQPPSNNLNRSIVGAWSTSNMTDQGTDSDHINESNSLQNGTNTTPTNAASKKRSASGEPFPKRRKPTTSTPIDHSPPTHVTLADIAGIQNVVEQFKELLILPMTKPRLFTNSHIQPPRGILIHGPPGCGKTMVANAFAAELGVSFISISAPSVISGMSGESEKALRDHFEEAKKCAPCLMFIDEIDVITPKREGAQKEMEKRIVAQLATCMDELDLSRTEGKVVIVLAATNRPDALDPALRRGGRFDKEINMPVPGEAAREQILRAMLRENINSDVDCAVLARRTPGFVGADLKDLVSTAGAAAISRLVTLYESSALQTTDDVDTTGVAPDIANIRRLIRHAKESSNADESLPVQFTMADFLTALPKIQPSALREGFATIPSTTFESIGALSSQIAEVQFSIIEPILRPEIYRDMGLTPPSGALLWGPPGCGKTLLAKAVANSSHANFISVKGPELLDKYVGESERAVRQVFTRARSSVPVIIFFDELDGLAPRRDGSMNEASQRVVNTFLTELDGAGSSREGIFIIAATNRPDMIDPAMLRPGRLDSLLYVGLPDEAGRVDILQTLCRKLNNFIWTDEMADLARSCDGFSGADFDMLLKRAGQAALARYPVEQIIGRDGQDPAYQASALARPRITLTVADFEIAKAKVRRSVGMDDMRRYERMKREWEEGTR